MIQLLQPLKSTPTQAHLSTERPREAAPFSNYIAAPAAVRQKKMQDAPDAHGGGPVGNRTDAAVGQSLNKLESLLLRNCFETLIPKNQGGIFDGGLANEYWNSIFSDELANIVSSQGILSFHKDFGNRL